MKLKHHYTPEEFELLKEKYNQFLKSNEPEAKIEECGELHICGNCGRTLPYNREGKEIHHWVCYYCHWCGYKLKGGIF